MAVLVRPPLTYQILRDSAEKPRWRGKARAVSLSEMNECSTNAATSIAEQHAFITSMHISQVYDHTRSSIDANKTNRREGNETRYVIHVRTEKRRWGVLLAYFIDCTLRARFPFATKIDKSAIRISSSTRRYTSSSSILTSCYREPHAHSAPPPSYHCNERRTHTSPSILNTQYIETGCETREKVIALMGALSWNFSIPFLRLTPRHRRRIPLTAFFVLYTDVSAKTCRKK